MLTAGTLRFDPQGRIIVSDDPVVHFNGGTPVTADGSLAAATGGTPELYYAAIGYLEDGRITDSTNPLVAVGGPLTNRDGQIRISNALPAYWYAGLPLTADGHLSVSPGILPPDLGAFDDSFDDSFDIGD